MQQLVITTQEATRLEQAGISVPDSVIISDKLEPGIREMPNVLDQLNTLAVKSTHEIESTESMRLLKTPKKRKMNKASRKRGFHL